MFAGPAAALRQHPLAAGRRRARHDRRASSARGRRSIAGRLPRRRGAGAHRGALQALSPSAAAPARHAPHARFGFAVLIDCHSMPSSSLAPATSGVAARHHARRPLRHELRAGADRLRRSAAARRGYTVARNKPYAGGFITEHYGEPARGLHALQIEINRALYMDERSLARRPDFDAVAADLRDAFAAVAAEIEGELARTASPPSSRRPARSVELRAENSTTLRHFSVSSAMILPKSAGVPPMGVPPSSARRCDIFGSVSGRVHLRVEPVDDLAAACPSARRCRTTRSPRSPARSRRRSARRAAPASRSRRRHGERAQLAALDVLDRGRQVVEEHVDLAGDQVGRAPGRRRWYGTCSMSTPVIALNSSPEGGPRCRCPRRPC